MTHCSRTSLAQENEPFDKRLTRREADAAALVRSSAIMFMTADIAADTLRLGLVTQATERRSGDCGGAGRWSGLPPYVGLLVIAILGFLFSLALDEIERMLIPWKATA
jgi:hypothetical protein